jgi:hypothetical protein
LRWRALLNDFQRSGLTHAEFCRRRGLSLHTFRKRLYDQRAVATGIERNAPKSRPRPEPTRFLPVTLRPDIPSNDPLTLVLSDGRRVAIGKGFDSDTLRRLITVLEQRP